MTHFVLIYLAIGYTFSIGKVIVDSDLKDSFGLRRGKRPAYWELLWWIVIFACVWPLGVWFTVEPLILFITDYKTAKEEHEAAKPFEVKRGHLVKPCSLEEIEAQAVVFDPLGGAPNVPFGHLNSVWVTFRDSLPKGSTLWAFKGEWPRSQWTSKILNGYVVSDGVKIGKHVVVKTHDVRL